MALPTTISATAFPDQNYFQGPFIDGNGNIYILLSDSSTFTPEIWKATDPTSSFSEQDNVGRPSGTFRYTSWVFQDGDTLHIAGHDIAGTDQYEYATFTTSDHGATPDEWVVVNEAIEVPSDQSAFGELSISIAPRSDGTVVVLYNGDEDKVKGLPYARVDYNIRSTGGTWGGATEVTSGMDKLEVDYFGSVIVRGASDKCHFFWVSDTAAGRTGQHASLTSGDSLSSTQGTISETTLGNHSNGPGVYFDDGGTERIRVPWSRVTAADPVDIIIINNDGTPTSVGNVSDGNDVAIANGSNIFCLAVDGTTVHLLYANNDDTSDLYHDQAATPQGASDWGTDTEELDAVTINRISCLAGETRVITRNGIKSIKELAGTTQTLLTRSIDNKGRCGKWVDAPIKSFGYQSLMKITLTRNKRKKEIYATPEHRWFVSKKRTRYLPKTREVTTSQLIPGDVLTQVRAWNSNHFRHVSPYGVPAGIVFGDGSRDSKGGCTINLYGEKNKQLLEWFPKAVPHEYTDDNHAEPFTKVNGLPGFFKDLPELNEDTSYLYGWLAGFFAADGTVVKGNISLYQADRRVLEFVETVCLRLGIDTFGITGGHYPTGFNPNAEMYRLTFVAESLTEDFFLIAEHRNRFLDISKPGGRISWMVESIEETDRIEEVFCAVVPETHSFALEGNILTGNCNVYTRSGTKYLAYVYDDGGVVKYNEKSLSVALTAGEMVAATSPHYGLGAWQRATMVPF